MCWLVNCPPNKDIPSDYIDKAQQVNKDGYGVIWFDNGVQVFKTMDYTEFKTKLATLTPFSKIVHLRFTSMGKTTLDNAHPFDCGNGTYLCHNGTMSNMRTVACTTTCIDNSDTKNLAEIIKLCKWEKISDILPLIHQITGTTGNKLVFMEADGNVTIVNKSLGNEEDGIWYSNTYHKPYTPTTTTYNNFKKVFVYGTLKKGGSNHAYLATSKFIGNAELTGKWLMIGEDMPFPYLLKQDPNGRTIKGELYEVSDYVYAQLCKLEGTPYLYTPKLIGYIHDGLYSQAYTFVKTTITPEDLSKPFISEFKIQTQPTSTFDHEKTYSISTIPTFTEDELEEMSHYSLFRYLQALETIYYGKVITKSLTIKKDLINEILETYEWFIDGYNICGPTTSISDYI